MNFFFPKHSRQKSISEQNPIEQLPKDPLQKVLTYLDDPVDLLRASHVNRYWRRICEQSSVIESVIKKTDPNFDPSILGKLQKPIVQYATKWIKTQNNFTEKGQYQIIDLPTTQGIVTRKRPIVGILTNNRIIKFFENFFCIEDEKENQEKTIKVCWNMNFQHKTVAWTEDGRYVFIDFQDGYWLDLSQKAAEVWDIEQSVNEPIYILDITNIKRACFSPNGQYLAMVQDNENIYFLNLNNSKTLETLETKLETAKIQSPEKVTIAFSPDNNYLVLTSNYKISIWEIKADKAEPFFEKQLGCSHFRFSPTGKKLLVFLSNGDLFLIEFFPNKAVTNNLAFDWDFEHRDFYFSASENQLIAISKTTIYLCDLQEENWAPKILGVHKIPIKKHLKPFISKDGKKLVIIDDDNNKLFLVNLKHQPLVVLSIPIEINKNFFDIFFLDNSEQIVIFNYSWHSYTVAKHEKTLIDFSVSIEDVDFTKFNNEKKFNFWQSLTLKKATNR